MDNQQIDICGTHSDTLHTYTATGNDPVNPSHYKQGGIETIDIMKAKLTPEGFQGYLIGNVIKYSTRYNLKNGLEDLKKAQWYLNRLISEIESSP